MSPISAETVPGERRMPAVTRYAFVVLLAAVVFQALHELFGVAGSRYSNFSDSYIYDAVGQAQPC